MVHLQSQWVLPDPFSEPKVDIDDFNKVYSKKKKTCPELIV